MKARVIYLSLLFVLTSWLCIRTSFAQADTVKTGRKHLSGYIENSYLRHYLWRGALWGSNDVSQPELHVDYGNFSLATSSNFNIFPKNLPEKFYSKKTAFDEQDLELGYQNNKGKLQYQFLLWGYFYFNQIGTANTGELYTRLQYPVLKHTKIFTENIADIAAYKGAFYNSTGFIYEREMNSWVLEAKLFTGLGNTKFNNTYFETDAGSLNLVGSSLNIEYTFPNNLYLSAKGEYNQYCSKQIKAVTGLNHTDNFSVYFGLVF